MSRAQYLVGDVFEVLATLPDQSVNSVITSPPYWRKRRYLPADHPDADKEIGQEATPGEFLAVMLRITDELHRIVTADGTIWFNLGDTFSGSGGAGGDYDEGGAREGQLKYSGSARKRVREGVVDYRTSRSVGPDTPSVKSVCWIPQLFGASLAYGRNLLAGEPCQQWTTRPAVTWCKPSVTPGRCDDRFRFATELVVWASKGSSYYWDRPSILEPLADSPGNRYERKVSDTDAARRPAGSTLASTDNRITADYTANPEGTPPFDWWVIGTSRYEGSHFATFPPELIRRPVLASCPPGGTILDPFGGSGTTALVATGNGRNCISIDLDARNLDLARERVGMFLDEQAGAA